MCKSAYRKAVNTWLAHIKSLGFEYQKHKVVGDDAFQKKNDYVKLLGARNGKLQVFRKNVGRYEVKIGEIS